MVKRIEWEEHEYVQSEKSPDWLWAVGIITVSAALAAILFGNILFAIVILVGSFSLTLHALKEPPIRRYSINERGIGIDDIMYPYESLEAFWIDDTSIQVKALVRSKKLLTPLILMPIPDDMDEEEVRDHLAYYLPAQEMREPFLHKLFERLGF